MLLRREGSPWFEGPERMGRRRESNVSNAEVDAKDEERYQEGVSIPVVEDPAASLELHEERIAWDKNEESDFKTTSFDCRDMHELVHDLIKESVFRLPLMTRRRLRWKSPAQAPCL